MKIGGFIKNSLIDYPGKISSIVFTSGCNFRCKYCHNPELVIPEKIKECRLIPEEFVFSFLKENKNMLDAVTITGGEPTLHKGLIDFLIQIKSIGLLVKLDTNGTNPELLENIINLKLVDYFAMDIKAPLELQKYRFIVGDLVSDDTIEKVKKSIDVIIQSGILHEFRTTVVKQATSKEDILHIYNAIKGCSIFCL
ncbi:MAG: anaerobic ribonucleoside-triphosphate reductase activating protein, partial [Bacteroidales bacterium]|nr:anaerobic ribonucleoside-triphosphate reductase activating protein [Bacteroidales bacterium]